VKISILKILRCPICTSELSLHSFVQETIECPEDNCMHQTGHNPRSNGIEKVIKEGILLCTKCKVWYPIYSYIPVMLTFENAFNKHFCKEHSVQLVQFPDYKMPTEAPRPGELSVQDTFTDQWDCVQNDELSFIYTREDLKELHDKVWLKGVECSGGRIKTVLNVGCGLGRESVALQEITDNAELFAIDLNFALLRSGEIYKGRPGIHFVIASLFALPFELSSFDLVYSQGVIHHTYCTYTAFNAIASRVRNGGDLFIWVYGLDDHLVYRSGVGLLKRTKLIAEGILRPCLSRSPRMVRNIFFTVISLVYHPIGRVKARHSKRWKIRNTNHLLRDWLSPRYAHRHSYNEVFEWFEDVGFKIANVQSPAAYRRLFGKSLWGVGVTGKKGERMQRS